MPFGGGGGGGGSDSDSDNNDYDDEDDDNDGDGDSDGDNWILIYYHAGLTVYWPITESAQNIYIYIYIYIYIQGVPGGKDLIRESVP